MEHAVLYQENDALPLYLSFKSYTHSQCKYSVFSYLCNKIERKMFKNDVIFKIILKSVYWNYLIMKQLIPTV